MAKDFLFASSFCSQTKKGAVPHGRQPPADVNKNGLDQTFLFEIPTTFDRLTAVGSYQKEIRDDAMDLVIRQARAEDAPFLAWLILSAGRAHVKRGIWEVVLGVSEEKSLAFLELLAKTEQPHLFHHHCYLVAEAEGCLVGGLGGHDPSVLGYPALQRALPEVFRKMGLALPQGDLEKGALRILACIPDAAEGAWVIDSVATIPGFRRRGVASLLLDAILAKGRALGFQRAQISIYLGNTAAQRAYEKKGFAIIDEKRDPYFEAEIGSPGMARMLRDL
jgi:translation initiation factor 4G